MGGTVLTHANVDDNATLRIFGGSFGALVADTAPLSRIS